MIKLFFFCVMISFFMKWKNFFILLLNMEMFVVGFIFFSSSFLQVKFILIIFLFVMGSIIGLLIFMCIMKSFSSFLTNIWFF